MLKARAHIPPIFGTVTYVLAAIAAAGTPVRLRDISASLGESAERALRAEEGATGIVRTFRMTTQQGHGLRPMAVMFDETFPLAKQVVALARKIGMTHPLPLAAPWPKEVPPAPKRKHHTVDSLCGTEVNTLVLATTRLLRGKVGRTELEAAVPHESLIAVERAHRRLRTCGILDTPGTDFADAPWRQQLERLFDAYLRLRPKVRERIRARVKTKREYRARRLSETLFGFHSTERVLVTLAVHGPMTRARLRSITLVTHQTTALKPLIDAGVLATQTVSGSKGEGTRAHGTRRRLVVGLNPTFPVYKELRALLMALNDTGEADRTTPPFAASSPRATYDVTALFSTAPLLWALLMMNAVPGHEIDVTSLHRLRPQHAQFTLRGRMRWLLKQDLIEQRRQGLIIYYRLNPEHRLYGPLKRLLDRIGKAWPDLVDAAAFNDDLKPDRRRLQDRNARRRAATRS